MALDGRIRARNVMDYEHLIYTKDQGIATITLNRPQKLNAFTSVMYQGILNMIADAAGDDGVRVLVITGTGRAFCVGADVKNLEQGLAKGNPGHVPADPSADAVSQILTLPLQKMNKPVIAAINGIAAGGGLDAACACDIRIASEKASFSSVFVRRGIVPTMGGTYFLPRLVGLDKACEMIWTGDLVDAEEAQRIGLVTRVVPHDELEAATEELALKIATGPPLAIKESKRLIYNGLNTDLESALRELIRSYITLGASEDHREALRAFLEKREPVFTGR
jgi:2-(1,2-epoxy-1,2-dihydrophenyl)acetyl-CoA isomerase